MPVVARYRDLPGAETAKSSLTAAGILAWTFDAYTIGVAWTYSQALGWIRLSVAEKDVDSAAEILASDFRNQVEESGEGAAETCPACGSEDLELEKGSRKTLALMLVTHVPLWFWRTRLRCRSCGWERKVPLRFRPELAAVIVLFGLLAVVVPAAIFAALALVINFVKDMRGPY